MALRIVTDSTADLPKEILNEYGIEMVPLTVHFGPESFMDAVEMDSDAFWAKLSTSPHHPKTAQPSPGDFLQIYERLSKAGDEILSIHLSGNLSGTLNSAQIAAKMLPTAQITTVDTRTVSLGLGMIVIQAARMARSGKTKDQIVDWINSVYPGTYIYFTLDTLDFLQKNGRIGKAQALIGGLLGVKVILQVDREGLVAPADKVRGKSKVLPRALELMQEKVPAGRRIWMAILHAQASEEAERWVTEVKKLYDVQEHWVVPIGPVVATNAGPGTVGVAFFEV